MATTPYLSTREHDLVDLLPPVSQAMLLKSLRDVVATSQRLLSYQPSLAQVCKDTFQWSLNSEFSGLGIDPDAVFVEERPASGTARS